MTNPPPTTDPDPPAPLCSVPMNPDASWHLQQTEAFKFPDPTDSLLQSKGRGLVADHYHNNFLGILMPMIATRYRWVDKN